MEIKNYMEELVLNTINDVIGDIDVCSCDKGNPWHDEKRELKTHFRNST